MIAAILERLRLRRHEHFYAEIVIVRPFPDSFVEMIGGWRCACGAIASYRGTEADQRRRFDPLENMRAAARIHSDQTWADVVKAAEGLTVESGYREPPAAE